MVKLIAKRDLKEFFPKEFSSRALIGQFLDYIMNHFFQPSDEIEINGYIGKKTVAMNDGDYYIEEPTYERQNYQLTPTLITTNDDNEIDTIVGYNNFINELKMQGVDTNDITRIINEKYWSWCPLINVDMFVNYNYYYWMEEGPTVVEITEQTDVRQDVIGKPSYVYYNDENDETNNKVLTSGMKIRFVNDVNSEYNHIDFIVEGVGSSIQLIDDSTTTSTTTTPDYFVMERGCQDGNKWSKRNRWFHRSTIIDGDKNVTLIQAKKPIICFRKNIELYNFGSYDRGNVDFIYDGAKSDIHGKSFNSLFQGVRELEDGDKILIIGDSITENNNKIYEVSGKTTIKTIVLQPLYNGLTEDGSATLGDGVYVKNGTNANKYFYFDGLKWVEGQQKLNVNQSPLFNLYDKDGIALDNKLYYNQSSFKGCRLFDYKTSDNSLATIDEDLGKVVLTNGYGNYIFENVLNTDSYTYLNYNETETIRGYKFVKILDEEKFLNDWHLSSDTNNQYITTEIQVGDIEYDVEIYEYYDSVSKTKREGTKLYVEYDLAYEPDESSVRNTSLIYHNGVLLNEGTDYIIDGKTLKIYESVELTKNDYLYIKLLKKGLRESLENGYFYDLPLSLTSNPLNQDITFINYNECFDQMTDIISNQKGFSGNSSGNNNYLDTKQDLSVGTSIIQHSQQILKTMLLNANDDTNVRNVISYVSDEYSKIKEKFKNVVETMSKTNEYTESSNVYSIISTALSKINIGKIGLNPFYNNGVCQQLGECYIPATPAYLGLDNCYQPRITTVEEKEDGKNVLLCHDGSYQVLFNDFRDEALLELETQIYQSINLSFFEKPDFNKWVIIPGKFRETDYTYNEYKSLLSTFFEKWCVDNRLDYSDHSNYNVADQFTWNYTGCFDKDGNSVSGSYKSIYLYYYDTYMPHKCPWEMLGFGDKPDWWEDKYGKAPYTSSNKPMWKDIENGYVAEGLNKGYHTEFARKGLIEKYLPVDEQGNLLTPYEIGIIDKKPIAYYASKEWNSGDIGMVESMWRYTSNFRFALQTVLYLLKPVEWVENNWETIGRETIFSGTDYEQLIYSDTLDRRLNNETYIHNELKDGKYIKKIGIQQWVSDYLTKNNLDITDYFGNPYRSIDIKLMYRCAGFYKKDSLTVKSDNYGIIPPDNYQLNMYKSQTSNMFNYSAIIISRTEEGYKIDGYDNVNPWFNVLTPEKNGKKSSVEINGKNVTYYNVWKNEIKQIRYKTIYSSVQELFDIICGYGKYLETVEGWEFISLSSNGTVIDFNRKAEDFLRWTSFSPTVDQMILLNPAATEVRLNHSGMLDIVGKRLNGVWTVLGTSFKPIYNEKLFVYRHQGYTDIETKDDIITSLRLNSITYEHCILFDNETIYGDVLYDPLLCVKTQRFKIDAIGANNWSGTLFAPGYLIQSDGCIANYDKLVDDFNYLYDTDDIHTVGDYRTMAQRTIGYKKSTVMENLLLSDCNMFDFYKGSLKEKGTRRSLGKLNRSSYIMNSNDSEIDLYDNWAFKIADFGYTKQSSVIELNIEANKITQNPQIIAFTTDDTYEGDNSEIVIKPNDDNWLRQIDIKSHNSFEYGSPNVNPTGGFLQLSDVNYVVADMDKFEEIKGNMNVGESIWIVNTNKYNWDVYKKIGDDDYISLRVDTVKEALNFKFEELNEGDLIFINRDIANNYLNRISDPNHLLNDEQYITNKNAWIIVKYNGSELEFYRIQPKNIDISVFDKCYIVNDDTDDSLAQIHLYDPLQNIVPNGVLDEINYITSYDPVNDYSDTYKWGDCKVGYLWWDTSKVRYLDYHQGETKYRRDNWGKQLPGSEIAIMEWICSASLPEDITKYVHKEVYNPKTATYDDYYYYWTKNPSEIPDKSFRTLSALSISNVINNPTSEGIIWFAPIELSKDIASTNKFIITNFDDVSTGNDFVVQMNLKDEQGLNNHTEWVMVREGDDDEIPDTLWSKMKDSILGMDDIGQTVPDESLNKRDRLGIKIRPRQTMFNDMALARQNLINIWNEIFATRDVLTTTDVGTNDFNETFLDIDVPSEYDYSFEKHYEMDAAVDSELIGKTILVKNDENYDGIWTLWTMLGIGKFELKSYQTYDVSKYWTYTDLYQNDETYLIQPEYEFDSEKEMNSYISENSLIPETYIKTYDNNGKWMLYEYVGQDDDGQTIVYKIGIEDGAINMNSMCYDFLKDEEILNDKTIFIDGMTKYEYLLKESCIILKKIFAYFENV